MNDIMVDIPDGQREIYQSSFEKGGDSPKGFRWRDRLTQELRFEKLLEKIDTKKNPSICDFGCGTGDLHQFLTRKKVEHEYTGIEIVEDMVDIARVKHPDAEFLLDKRLRDIPDSEYDIIVCSGVFFVRGRNDRDLWIQYLEETVSEMYRICKIGTSFNFLGDWTDWEEEDLAYISMSEIDSICKKITRFRHIDCTYPLFEGTVTLLKNRQVIEEYPQDEFRRYLGDHNG